MLRKAEATYWLKFYENAHSSRDFWKIASLVTLTKQNIAACYVRNESQY